MELDDFKRAWQEMEVRQDGVEALVRMDARAQRAAGVRATLRPLLWGQLLQMLLGVALSIWGAALWADHLRHWSLLLCGGAVHAYGLLMIVLAARSLYLLQAIDFAAPVLDMQRRLAAMRAFRVRVEAPLNLVACSFLWIPVAWAALQALGIRVGPGPFLAWAIASSFAGVLAILCLVWVLHRCGRARAVTDELAGRSVTRAQARLDEIARFERD